MKNNFMSRVDAVISKLAMDEMEKVIKNSPEDRSLNDLYEELKAIDEKYRNLTHRLKEQFDFDMEFVAKVNSEYFN